MYSTPHLVSDTFPPSQVGPGGGATIYIYIYIGPPKPTCLEVFMVNNLVFRWPKPLFFMVLGAHGIYSISTNIYIFIYLNLYVYIHRVPGNADTLY